jgi:hypothetical protein
MRLQLISLQNQQQVQVRMRLQQLRQKQVPEQQQQALERQGQFLVYHKQIKTEPRWQRSEKRISFHFL